jgi:hypothetical protein
MNGGLAPRILVGEDGSRLFFKTFYDLDHEVNVGLGGYLDTGVTVTGDARLLPMPADSVPRFTDDPATACPPPVLDLLRVDGCTITDSTAYVRIGGSVFSTAPADVTAYTCASLPEGSGETVIRLPAMPLLRLTEVPLDSWRQAVPVLAGTGRFRYRAWEVGCFSVPDTGPWVFDTLFDGLPCSPFVTDDGVLRCIAAAYSATVAFADAQCTRRIAARADDGWTPPFAIEGQPSSGFPDAVEPVRVYELGPGTPAVPFYWSGPNGECWLFSDPRGWITYELGAPVPAATFGAVSIVLR